MGQQKDIELHVSAAPSAKNVDLDSQVNHKVELVGMISSKDLMAIKGGKSAGGQSGTGTTGSGYGTGSTGSAGTTGTAGTGTTGTGTGTSTSGQTSGQMSSSSSMNTPPLLFKANSIKSISDKCQ